MSHSTIGAEEFNGRVRNGIGFRLLARTTRPAKDRELRSNLLWPHGSRRAFALLTMRSHFQPHPDYPRLASIDAQSATADLRTAVSKDEPRKGVDIENESNQVNRTISTGKLRTLPHFHTRPINVVVFHGSQGNSRFEVGFPLRCLQRLSRPYIATLHCRWRDNSSTRGTFIPVLSY